VARWRDEIFSCPPSSDIKSRSVKMLTSSPSFPLFPSFLSLPHPLDKFSSVSLLHLIPICLTFPLGCGGREPPFIVQLVGLPLLRDLTVPSFSCVGCESLTLVRPPSSHVPLFLRYSSLAMGYQVPTSHHRALSCPHREPKLFN